MSAISVTTASASVVTTSTALSGLTRLLRLSLRRLPLHLLPLRLLARLPLLALPHLLIPLSLSLRVATIHGWLAIALPRPINGGLTNLVATIHGWLAIALPRPINGGLPSLVATIHGRLTVSMSSPVVLNGSIVRRRTVRVEAASVRDVRSRAIRSCRGHPFRCRLSIRRALQGSANFGRVRARSISDAPPRIGGGDRRIHSLTRPPSLSSGGSTIKGSSRGSVCRRGSAMSRHHVSGHGRARLARPVNGSRQHRICGSVRGQLSVGRE